jgi:uncharacterized protein YecE (DUF72 family)
MEVHIGCSGWFYWHWRGIFYPDTKRTDTWFKHYTENFRTVELNAPFYSWPKIATVKSWRRNAPEGFRYSVKVNRLITHEKRMVHTRMLVEEFYKFAEILGPTLGCFPVSVSAELSLHAFTSAKHPAAARSAVPQRGGVPPQELVARIGLQEVRRTPAVVLHRQRAAYSA